MSALAIRRPLADRAGERTLPGLGILAAVAAVGVLGLIVFKVLDLAGPAFSRFGLSFLTSTAWDPVAGRFGALDFIYGTAVTTVIALLLTAPLAMGIALYLTELAPRLLRGPVAALVQLLAAVPTVVVGLWGILVLGPFAQSTLEPALRSALGFIPIFAGPASPLGALPAALVLTLITLPIAASVTRDVFLTVPRPLKESALALGATRWEMVRAVVLPVARPGFVAAMMLALGRAVGEAIAITQVIGGASAIGVSLFAPADTLASRIAGQYQGAATGLQISSLAYLGAVLLLISLLANALARLVVARIARRTAA